MSSRKAQAGGVAVGGVRRKRAVPFLAAGVVLVLAGALGFSLLATQLGGRTLVLAVARPVAAGQTISDADLRAVSAAQDDGLKLIPIEQKAQVVGRTAAVPLVTGSLLVPAQLGKAVFPPPGQASATLALKAGQYPASLSAGATVTVFLPAAQHVATSTAAGPVSVKATVVSVSLNADLGALVSLLVDTADAGKLAAAGTTGLMLMQTAASAGS